MTSHARIPSNRAYQLDYTENSPTNSNSTTPNVSPRQIITKEQSKLNSSIKMRRSSPEGRGDSMPHQRKADSRQSDSTLYETSTAAERLSKSSYVLEADCTTIQKQRRELQLLIAQLKDQDRELNETVKSHELQMAAWESDRKQLLLLQQKTARLEDELSGRSQQIGELTARHKFHESELDSLRRQLETKQEQLAKLGERASEKSMHLVELEEKNKDLNNSLRDVSSAVGQLEGREQELMTMVRLRDEDLQKAANHIHELSAKLRRIDAKSRQSEQTEQSLRAEIESVRAQQLQTRAELDRARNDVAESRARVKELEMTVQRYRQDREELKRDLQLANERERRKDDLINLQTSRQQRADSELSATRQLYERSQRDTLLNLQTISSSTTVVKTPSPRSFSNQSQRSKSPKNAPNRNTQSYSPHESNKNRSFGEKNSDKMADPAIQRKSRSPVRGDKIEDPKRQQSPLRPAAFQPNLAGRKTTFDLRKENGSVSYPQFKIPESFKFGSIMKSAQAATNIKVSALADDGEIADDAGIADESRNIADELGALSLGNTNNGNAACAVCRGAKFDGIGSHLCICDEISDVSSQSINEGHELEADLSSDGGLDHHHTDQWALSKHERSLSASPEKQPKRRFLSNERSAKVYYASPASNRLSPKANYAPFVANQHSPVASNAPGLSNGFAGPAFQSSPKEGSSKTVETQGDYSPTSKLHRMINESRNMLASMDVSPNKTH